MIKYSPVFFLLFSILLVFGIVSEVISFGSGLGDIGMLLISMLFAVVFLILYFFKSKISNFTWNIITLCIYSLILYFVLQFSLFRGPENSWDGKVFF